MKGLFEIKKLREIIWFDVRFSENMVRFVFFTRCEIHPFTLLPTKSM